MSCSFAEQEIARETAQATDASLRCRLIHCPLLFFVLIWLISLPLSPALTLGQELEPLSYNHPGLTTDLGVGLWAWPLPCDADGDGDYDLIVSCPDKPSNGIWFFENTSGDTARNKLPIFAPSRRLSATVRDIMPSYVAGEMRVLSPGLEYRDFLELGATESASLPIEAKFYQPDGPQKVGPGLRHNQWRYADFDGDELLDLVVGIEDWSHYGWDNGWNEQGQWTNGPLHGYVYIFMNRGSNSAPKYEQPFKLTCESGAIDVYGCPSPNFEDFDGDGDLDLLCGEFLDGFTYFQNVGTRSDAQYANGVKLQGVDSQPLQMDLQMIVPVAFDWDRDGDVDLIVGDEDGRVAFIEHTGEVIEGLPQFQQPVYFQQVADKLKCGALATPVGFDWDSDGDWDILSGNTAGTIEFFENLSGPGVTPPRWAAPERLKAGNEGFRIMAGPTGSIQGPAEAKWGYTTFSVADWNHDQKPDIVFNSIWGRIQWLENVADHGQLPELAAAKDVTVDWSGEPPRPAWLWWQPDSQQLVTQWRTTPIAMDWTGDGLCDLVMLDHEGYLALYERKQTAGMPLKPPQRIFNLRTSDPVEDSSNELLQLNAGVAGKSGRRKLCVVDWDRDGLLDVFANSQNADWLHQIPSDIPGNHLFENLGPMSSQNVQGHTTSPTAVDFDGDGNMELLIGAEDGRMYYLR